MPKTWSSRHAEVLVDLIPVTKAQIYVKEAVRHDVFIGLSSDELVTQRLCIRPPPGETVGHAKRADPRCTLRYRNDPLEYINRTLVLTKLATQTPRRFHPWIVDKCCLC